MEGLMNDYHDEDISNVCAPLPLTCAISYRAALPRY